MTDLRIARRSADVLLDGALHRVRRGRTLAVGGHPIVGQRPDLWRPLAVDYDVDVEPELEHVDVAPVRPAERDARGVWDAYAVALGLSPEYVAALSTKGDVIALADKVAAGHAVLGELEG